jgi:CO/xanthine dehydrogenase Mo-binding subunit
VRVADHLGRSADRVTLDSMGPLWEPLGLVSSGDPLTMSQQDQDAAAANPRWVPVITSRASASVGAPVATHAVAEAAYALLRYSLWPAARAIWPAGDDVAFDDLKWIDGKLTAEGKEPLSFVRLAERCHASGQMTGVMVHAFSRWQWARAEFAIETDIWNGAIDALALRRGKDWRVQDRRKVDFPPASTERLGETYVAICGAVVALSVDRTNGAIQVLRVHEVLDCGRSIVPELVSGMAQGGIAMGLGHALTEYLPLYEDGPGNGTWNVNRYDVVRARDVPVWDMTLETLPPVEYDDAPRGIAEIVMVPVVPGTLNAIYDAIGKRFTRLPVTADDILAMQ